ncbi:multiprotein-bridging factor 1 family protein [Nocardia sp. NPDC051570]|uniref:multiprotein-bridging factor 1 family protein n=1 Tax=Nocardia sp. NPDC051570 TaxID=3364324 RepID=UPI0037B598B6
MRDYLRSHLQRRNDTAAADAQDRVPNEQLARLRLSHGWTQEELASAVAHALAEQGVTSGIDADYISRLERGLISWPTAPTRRALEGLLCVSATQMGFVNRRLGGPRRRVA